MEEIGIGVRRNYGKNKRECLRMEIVNLQTAWVRRLNHTYFFEASTVFFLCGNSFAALKIHCRTDLFHHWVDIYLPPASFTLKRTPQTACVLPVKLNTSKPKWLQKIERNAKMQGIRGDLQKNKEIASTSERSTSDDHEYLRDYDGAKQWITGCF